MSYDRDEIASILGNLEEFTDSMREFASTFDDIRRNAVEDTPLSPRGDSGSGIDLEAISKFNDTLLTAADSTEKLGRQFDSLADRLGDIIREQDSISRSMPERGTASASSDLVPVNVGVPRPAQSQVYPMEAQASPTRPNMPDGTYTPIKTYAQAEKWFIERETASKGIAGAYVALREQRQNIDIDKYLPLAQSGFSPELIGKIADKESKDALLKMAQTATARPVVPKPPKIKKPGVLRPSKWLRVRSQAMRGAYWGGVTGGMKGMLRGGIMGAGVNLFNNPAVVAAAAGLALPLMLSQTAAMADRQIDSSRRWMAFAPNTMNAMMDYDINNMGRNINLAQATSGTAVNLIRQQDRTRQAMVPYETFSQNASNTASMLLSAVAEGGMNRLSNIFMAMNEGITAESVQTNLPGLGRAAGGALATMGAVGLFTSPLNAIPLVGTGAWIAVTLGAGAWSFMTGLLGEESSEEKMAKVQVPHEKLNFGMPGKAAPRPRAF